MAKLPSLLAIRPRSLSTRVLVLGAIITFAIALYTFSSTEYSFRISDWSSIFSQQRQHSPCTPEQWSDGRWVYSPTSDLKNLTSPEQALALAGFEGCAADREYHWHLGTDHEEQWDRFPKVSSYRWAPSSQCDVHPLNGAAMVKDMVENGGWLLLGDSITENHFFSLSCLLYPHVRATPNYTENPYFDRAWQQNLYLSPSSPIIPEIAMPEGFSIENTPLVSFRRVDLLLNGTELDAIYHSSAFFDEPTDFDSEDPSSQPNRTESLFSDEAFWSLSPSEYMPTFLDSPPDANYGTLVVSTAGHWTTTVFGAFRDDDAGEDAGYGIQNVLAFFKVAMRAWAEEVQDAITEYHINGGTRPKQVVVRAYLPGHENCHNIFEPTKSITPWVNKWYNWPWIADFNTEFQEVLSSSSEFPDIYYLPIERPGRLRPDAHAAGDCLHLISGAGVIEGWSHYIWHFVTREVQRRI
ncbi:hypothetical protein DEU56DRAFT_528860 [Suillus clintonianus]|uniref:uncharacterized protein n=1 Tax=Suillus clintonianus TaxID=1904413 RepID=UPI001B87AD41|nr:uncharacterized protein DEU56DRAFT_528860 [Suillus clintonianus]KAG2127491.1 hypothetical protein DEU56DRAFT_528860 [Suillus clintonianus]